MSDDRPRLLPSGLKRLALLGGIWLALAGTGREALLVGAVAAPAAVWLSLALLPPVAPVRLARAALLAPGFVARSVIGGIDVAWRAFHPRLPLRPGWLAFPTGLPDVGRVALGAEIALMPGSLAAGTRGGRLLIHVLDREGDHVRRLAAEEARLAGLLPERAR
jgi:multicomponent Na+:H+ antiporter subunit E